MGSTAAKGGMGQRLDESLLQGCAYAGSAWTINPTGAWPEHQKMPAVSGSPLQAQVAMAVLSWSPALPSPQWLVRCRAFSSVSPCTCRPPKAGAACGVGRFKVLHVSKKRALSCLMSLPELHVTKQHCYSPARSAPTRRSLAFGRDPELSEPVRLLPVLLLQVLELDQPGLTRLVNTRCTGQAGVRATAP